MLAVNKSFIKNAKLKKFGVIIRGSLNRAPF